MSLKINSALDKVTPDHNFWEFIFWLYLKQVKSRLLRQESCFYLRTLVLVNIGEQCPFLIIRCIGVDTKAFAKFQVFKLILPPLQFDHYNQSVIWLRRVNHLSYPDIHCVFYQHKICFRATHSKSQLLVLFHFAAFCS